MRPSHRGALYLHDVRAPLRLVKLKNSDLCSSAAMAASELLMRLYAKYAPTILRVLAPWSGLATQIAIRIVTTTTTLAASISISATSARGRTHQERDEDP